jgi:hypothetical protein
MDRNTYKLHDDGTRQSNSQVHRQTERIWKFEHQIPRDIHFSEKQKIKLDI